MKVAAVVAFMSGAVVTVVGFSSDSIVAAITGGALLLSGVIVACAAEIKEALEK